MLKKNLNTNIYYTVSNTQSPLNHAKNEVSREFFGSPVVRTWHFHFWGPGLIPGRGTKIPQDVRHSRKKKKRKKKRNK